MAGTASPKLTEKQSAVIQRIDRRMPIKLIASEMGVSETRINQHIRALKTTYHVGSLNQLVEAYRLDRRSSEQGVTAPKAVELGESAPLRNAAYRNKQLGNQSVISDLSDRDDPGSIRLSDAHVVARDAPWAHDIEPVVVFGALDGKHAVLYRFAVMVGIAFGMIAAVVLLVSAALTISEVLDGKAAVPVDTAGVAG